MNWTKTRNVFPFLFLCNGFLLLLLQTKSSLCYYVGPEVGHAKGETRLPRFIFGFPAPNATSLAEAAYVPYVYSVGNNVVTFLRSIIPALQPKVDFFAEQIQDGIDIANNKLMQTLENSNNGIIAVENFFTGLMKAFVFGKGPDDEDERRKRVAEAAMAMIKSGMLSTSSTTTTSTTTTSTTTTRRPTIATTTTKQSTTTGQPVKRSTTAKTSKGNVASSSIMNTTSSPVSEVPQVLKESNGKSSEEADKLRDNNFNKMKIVEILKNMLK